MADDLSASSRAPRGVDLISGQAGSFVRGQAPYVPTSTTITATLTTPWVELAGHAVPRLDAVVTAISGAGASATVQIQTSFDAGVTDAAAAVGASGAAITAAGTQRLRPGVADRWIRAVVTLTAGSSVTLSLSGEVA